MSTIQDIIDKGETIVAFCEASLCYHSSALDLIALRDRFGPDHGAMARDLVPKLRCTKCGARGVGRRGHEVSIRILPGSKEYRSNAYARAKNGR